MTGETHSKIKELARLKTEMDKIPNDSLLGLPLIEEFFDLYLQVGSELPTVQPDAINELILKEIARLSD